MSLLLLSYLPTFNTKDGWIAVQQQTGGSSSSMVNIESKIREILRELFKDIAKKGGTGDIRWKDMSPIQNAIIILFGMGAANTSFAYKVAMIWWTFAWKEDVRFQEAVSETLLLAAEHPGELAVFVLQYILYREGGTVYAFDPEGHLKQYPKQTSAAATAEKPADGKSETSPPSDDLPDYVSALVKFCKERGLSVSVFELKDGSELRSKDDKGDEQTH